MQAFLIPREVCKQLRVSRATLYRMISTGKFPPGKRVTDRRQVWAESTVNEWLEKRPHRDAEE
jgi:excisionase family DNA binding protein